MYFGFDGFVFVISTHTTLSPRIRILCVLFCCAQWHFFGRNKGALHCTTEYKHPHNKFKWNYFWFINYIWFVHSIMSCLSIYCCQTNAIYISVYKFYICKLLDLICFGFGIMIPWGTLCHSWIHLYPVCVAVSVYCVHWQCHKSKIGHENMKRELWSKTI